MFDKKMIWNGNEIVFEGEPLVGVAGIASDQDDKLASEIVKRWNAGVKKEPCDECSDKDVVEISLDMGFKLCPHCGLEFKGRKGD